MNAKIYLQRAFVYNAVRVYSLAAADLSIVLDQIPNSMEGLLLRAKVLTQQGMPNIALKVKNSIIIFILYIITDKIDK